MKPLVSIGMPIYNCETTLKIAINSILAQTYSNWELILIDDGSNDKTLEIAKSFTDSRIQVVSDGFNYQLPFRLNQAIALSKGKYFARMDGDDVSYPERLQAQVEYLEAHPDIDLLSTQVIGINKDGSAEGKFALKQSHVEICSSPRSGFWMTHPTWMGKIEWFRNNKYRLNAIRMEDQDLLLRTYKTSKFACLPKILLGYRVGSFSLKKSLLGRYNYSRALINQTFVQKDYLLAFGALEQAIKASVDIFAVVTGLKLKLLKHRYGSKVINSTELVQWQKVYSQCNSADNLMAVADI